MSNRAGTLPFLVKTLTSLNNHTTYYLSLLRWGKWLSPLCIKQQSNPYFHCTIKMKSCLSVFFPIMPLLFHLWITVFSCRLISNKQGNSPTPESTGFAVIFLYKSCNYAVRPVSFHRKLLWEMQGLQATLLDNWGQLAVAVMFFDWRFNVALHLRGGCWLSTIYKDSEARVRIWGYWSVRKAERQRLSSGGSVG